MVKYKEKGSKWSVIAMCRKQGGENFSTKIVKNVQKNVLKYDVVKKCHNFFTHCNYLNVLKTTQNVKKTIDEPWHSWREVWQQAHLWRPYARGIVSRLLKELVLWGWWSVSLWTSQCCFVATANLFFQLSVRCTQWPGFALIRFSCRCDIGVMLLHCVCCTRLIRTWMIVCSVSFHVLFQAHAFELPCVSFHVLYSLFSSFHVLRLHPFVIEFEVCMSRKSQFARCFLSAQTRVGNDLPYTVFDSETLDGFKSAVNRWLLSWVCFSVFPWRRCLWGCVSNL